MLLLAACGDVGDAPQAETGEAVDVAQAQGTPIPIDTAQSEVRWRGAKVTRAHDGGFRDFSGTVYVAGGSVTGVDLAIDMASIWSDSEKLTGHLKSPDFFEVETYPEATFEADRFEVVDSAGATHRVTGNLTMHGQTHSVAFPANILVEADRVTAEADFIIDRKRWGVSYPGKPDDLIADEVRILFDLVAEPADVVASAAPVTGPE